MKLAIIRPYPDILSDQGYNIQEFGLARALCRLGHDVDVYCSGGSIAKPEEQDLQPQITENLGNRDVSSGKFRVIRMPCKLLFHDQTVFPGLLKKLDGKKYDVLQTQGYYQIISFLISRYGKKKGIPVVVHEGLYQNDYGRLINSMLRMFHKSFGRSIRKNSSGGIAKTQRCGQFMQTLGFGNINVLPIGLDDGKFSNPEEVEWREKYNISPTAHVLLYVGRLEVRRNILFLIRVLNRIHESGFDVHLLMAGSGNQEQPARQLSREMDLDKRVHFLGPVPQNQLPSLYKQSDLFLLASDFEIVGMVLLESLFFGIPALSSRTAGAEDIIKNGYGQIMDEMDVDKWAQAAKNWFDSNWGKEHSEVLKKQPRQRTWDSVAGDYLKFYQSVIA